MLMFQYKNFRTLYMNNIFVLMGNVRPSLSNHVLDVSLKSSLGQLADTFSVSILCIYNLDEPKSEHMRIVNKIPHCSRQLCSRAIRQVQLVKAELWGVCSNPT